MDFFLSPQRSFRAISVRFHRSRCPHRSLLNSRKSIRVSVYSGAGMDNMCRITRRHSVKMAYLITTKNQND